MKSLPAPSRVILTAVGTAVTKTVSRAEATRYVWSSENDRRPAEPPGRLLGQRRGREFLRDAEGRARPRRDVGHADGGAHRAVRLARAYKTARRPWDRS